MYTRILIATDGSKLAGKAVEHGVRLAAAVGATAVFALVTEAWSALEFASDLDDTMGAGGEYRTAAVSSAKRVLDSAQETAAEAGVRSEARHVLDLRPAEGIIETAELEDCDLIVMASHGHRGLKKVLLGSQTTEVLTFSKIPVLVLR